ncbi:MAG: glycosyl hydrolase [Pseudomonadota bacterium]
MKANDWRTAIALCTLCVTVTTLGTARAAVIDEEAMQAMEYRLVGPYRGGRVTAVTGVPGKPRTYFMGSTGGGVWKTTDGGQRWFNVSDKEREIDPSPAPTVMGDVDPMLAASGRVRAPTGGLPKMTASTRTREGDEFGSASVGALAVAASDPNIVWAGMGSVDIRGNTSAGDGIYRSMDGGDTWQHMGLPEAGQIGRIRVHPQDPDVVYAAVLGHAFGPNPERGVYRTTDGGLTWSRVLHVSDKAGAVDLAMDPSNPRILYAAFWEAVRLPWDMISGGPGSGLYKSIDGGNTWQPLTEGLPEGTLGKIAVSVSPVAPNRVFALVEHETEWGLYRSDNGGKKFRRVSSDRNLITRAWYYTKVYADVQDVNTVYIMNVQMWRSDDGGKHFIPIRTPHGDNHDLWINPDDPKNMIQANDGGANVTYDGGRTWSTQANQPTAEIYRVTVDNQYPYWLYGGQQDNSPVAIPSRTAGAGIQRKDWYAPAGCETAYVAIDPRDADITYGGCYGGSIGRMDRGLGIEQEVMAWPQMAVGQAAKDLRFRFQWNAPIRISPHDPDVLYHASNHVHRSRDGGHSWEVVSDDLTRNDPEKQILAGGPITKDNTGVEVYGTIFALEESPVAPGVLWVGSDDGLVHISRDNGESWTNVTPNGLPEWGTVNVIAPSTHTAGRAFAAVHRYRTDDFAPYLYRTNDFGKSWTRLTSGANGIPDGHFVRAVVEDPNRQGLLYVGTEYGMYVSFDDGRAFQPLQLNLPLTPITDLKIKDQDLIVATQGRSLWILDDLSPLHQMTDQIARAEYHLFTPRPTIQFAGGGGNAAPGTPAGRNPSYGAAIYYLLPEGLEDEGDEATEVKLEILAGNDDVLRTLSSKEGEYTAPNVWRRMFPEFFEPRTLTAHAGMNKFVWDLRLKDPKMVDDAVLWGGPQGPEVPPGTYQARLSVGDWSSTVPVEVRADPRLDVPREAHEIRFALAYEIYESLERSHEVIRQARTVRDQAQAIAKVTENEVIRESVDALAEQLTAIETTVLQVKSKAPQDILNFTPMLDNQFLHLMGVVESAVGVPTEASVARFNELSAELDVVETKLVEILNNDLEKFQELVDSLETERVVVPSAGAVGGQR